MDIIEKAFYDSMFAKQREQEELAKHTYTIEKEKNDILAKPQVIEAAVSNLSEQYSPTGSSKKSRKENYGLDTVENSKAEDDPTRGMGYKIRDDYTKALMDQKYTGVPAGRLLQGVLDSHLKTPGNDGMSTLEKSYNYTRTEGSKKIFGTSTKPMPGYDEWYADKRAQEKADVDKESWIASPKDILESAGIGAVLQGTAAALGGGAGGAAAGAALGAAYGTALMPGVGTIGGAIAGGLGGLFTGGATTFAGGALLGAVEGAAGEILAQPLKKLLHKTDWYQGMVQSNSKLDNLKALATDALTYVPGGVAGNAGLKAATKNVMSDINVKGAVESPNGLFGGGSGMFNDLFEGKAPAGPGISIGGESVLSNPPPRLLPYEPTKMTTRANGILYDSEGRIILQPVNEGGPIFGKPGVITPELPAGKGVIYAGENKTTPDAEALEITKLIGYENRPIRPTGLINLDENITKDLPDGLSYKQKESPRLLEDKLYREPAEMEEFSRKAAGKLYTDFKIPTPGKKWTEPEIFERWQRYADGKTYTDFKVEEQKTIQKVLAKPTAKNIINNPLPTIEKELPRNTVYDDVNSLSLDGLAEVGQEIRPGVERLKGELADTSKIAKMRDDFVSIGKGDIELRKKIADNSSSELAGKKGSADTTLENSIVTDAEIKAKAAASRLRVAELRKQEKIAAEKALIDSGMLGKSIDDGQVGGSDVYNSATGKIKSNADTSLIPEKPISKQVKTVVKEDLDSMTKDPLEDSIDVSTGSLFTDTKGKELTRESIYNKWFTRNIGEGLSPADYTKGQVEAGIPQEIIEKEIKEVESRFNKFLKNTKSFKVVAGMALLGFSGDALYNILAPNEADAGMITDFIKTSSQTAAKKAALAESAFAKGYAAKGITSETVMGAENFQRGLQHDAAEMMTDIAKGIRKGVGGGVQYSLMSPYQALESIVKSGKNIMLNAAPYIASHMSAGATNMKNSKKVIKNILDEAGIKISANQVKTALDPFVEDASKVAKADILSAQAKQLEKSLLELRGRADIKDVTAHANDILIAEKELVDLQDAFEPLKGVAEKYHKDIDQVYRGLAKDHASVRVSLALEDPQRQLYPWLQLSRNEEVAVGKIRGLLDQYQARLTDRGIPTKENYFPHSPHPEMSKLFNKELEDILNGVPYQKFYSRTPNSRMLMPDVHYSMNHYLTDIEQRIQYHDVWKKSGWGTIRNSDFVQANPGLKKAFDNLHDGTKPQEQTWGNIAATRYAEFEAYKRLFLNPSAGLKHLIKLSGDVMSVGIKPVVKAAPETLRYVAKNTAEKLYDITPKTVKGLLSKVGVTSDRFTKSIMDNYTDSIIQGGRLRDAIMDMGIDSTDEVFNGIKAASKNLWQTTQDIGATWINLAELIDRGTSVNAALQISAKRGMTIDQALYGTYDLILKNNFLYGQFNPEWLRNPKIRAVFMFQATPFKLFEKRLVNAQRSYSSIKDLPDDIQKLWKTPEGKAKVIKDFKDLRHLIRTGESELKANLFIDALKNETDFFGTPVVQQFVRDVLTVGGATYAAGQAGMSVFDHFMHVPFISTQSEEGKPQLALSPVITKTMEGYTAWKNREVGDDFLLSTVMRKWLGPTGPLPATLEKAAKLYEGDIPEVYQRGGSSGYLKYLFGVPGKERD